MRDREPGARAGVAWRAGEAAERLQATDGLERGKRTHGLEALAIPLGN